MLSNKNKLKKNQNKNLFKINFYKEINNYVDLYLLINKEYLFINHYFNEKSSLNSNYFIVFNKLKTINLLKETLLINNIFDILFYKLKNKQKIYLNDFNRLIHKNLNYFNFDLLKLYFTIKAFRGLFFKFFKYIRGTVNLKFFNKHKLLKKNLNLKKNFLTFFNLEIKNRFKIMDINKNLILILIINETKNNIYITLSTLNNKIIFKEQKGFFYKNQNLYPKNLYKKSKKFVYENMGYKLFKYLEKNNLLLNLKIIKFNGTLSFKIKKIIKEIQTQYFIHNLKNKFYFNFNVLRAHNGCRKKKLRRL